MLWEPEERSGLSQPLPSFLLLRICGGMENLMFKIKLSDKILPWAFPSGTVNHIKGTLIASPGNEVNHIPHRPKFLNYSALTYLLQTSS